MDMGKTDRAAALAGYGEGMDTLPASQTGAAAFFIGRRR